MTLVLAEYVVMAAIRFLCAASDGIGNTTLDDHRLVGLRDEVRMPAVHAEERRGGVAYGILVPLSEKMKDELAQFGVFQLVAEKRFDAGRILLAFSRSNEVHWAAVDAGQGEQFLYYDFATGAVHPVPPRYGHARTLPAHQVYWKRSMPTGFKTLDDARAEAAEWFAARSEGRWDGDYDDGHVEWDSNAGSAWTEVVAGVGSDAAPGAG